MNIFNLDVKLYNFIGFRAETLWKPLLFHDFYIIWHSKSGKVEQINLINQGKSMSWFYTFSSLSLPGYSIISWAETCKLSRLPPAFHDLFPMLLVLLKARDYSKVHNPWIITPNTKVQKTMKSIQLLLLKPYFGRKH